MKKEKVTIQVNIVDPYLYKALSDIALKENKSLEQIVEEKLKEHPKIEAQILTEILAEVTRKDVVIAKLTDEDREAIRKGELKFSWE